MVNQVNANIENIKYKGKIDLSNKNNSHTLAYDLIEEDSLGVSCNILEVGCSSGYFGEALKTAGHIVWGIEMSPDAAQQAKSILDFVYVGTIESFLVSEFAIANKFDYVVFGDVLEHLPYPSDILCQCKSILKSTGGIVASIPNVAHLAVRVMLLEGRWEYGDLGIMDNTHLRFFDKNSIVGMFNTAGYSVQSMDCVKVGLEQTGIKVDKELYDAIDRLVHDDAKEIFQYVLLTKIAPVLQSPVKINSIASNDSLNVLCILPDTNLSLAKIRIIDPLRTWARRNHGALRIRQIDDFKDIDDAMWADVVVFQRESNVQVLNLIDYFKSLGTKVIFDIDDLLTQVPVFLQAHDASKRTGKFLKKALQNSDVLTTTNQLLKVELMSFNENVVVIKNCSSTIYSSASKENSDDVVRIIIASSDTILVDLVIPVLKRLIQCAEFEFKLIGIGPPGQFIKDAGVDVELHELMSYEEFKRFIASQPNAIGLIPLDNSKFSSCKSSIKFVDYSLANVVSICSDVPPYSNTVSDGITGILVKNEADSWYDAIVELSRSKERRRGLANAAMKHCQENFSLNHSAEEWQKLLLSMNIKKRDLNSGDLKWKNRKYRLKLFVKHLFEIASYEQALCLIKKHGVLGFVRKFFSYYFKYIK